MANRRNQQKRAEKEQKKQQNTPIFDNSDANSINEQKISPKNKKNTPFIGFLRSSRLIFRNIFTGRLLTKMNLAKNWKFLLMVVILIAIIIFTNLRLHNQRGEIQKLKDEVVIAHDKLMDAVEDGFIADENLETQLQETAVEKGFTNSGIPYEIFSDREEVTP
ncbi:MAG: hypothetical protein LBR36_04450 [Bacteroidales bacterium]|jgi:hypothetical protein|nr:hypothetical protein [Bacteroidales bacterium]